MFLRKPRLRRLIASWLLVQCSTQLVWPTVSYALTAGPTAPEATSFEPVDTTDMVNLNTGDLTYSIPLLEVPGPEGGYPLNLAYHAGIQPDVEASWVGLGWSLNPGAITRNVNGYADDHNNVSQVSRDYWIGGKYQSYSAGLSLGLGNVASVSAGLSFSHDTYRGFGVGPYASVGVGIGGDKSPVGISASFRNDGLGSNTASVSATIGRGTKNGASLGASVGLSTNFSSISANAGGGISYLHNSLMGASVSTDGGRFSLTGGGISTGIHNDKAGNIQTQSGGSSLDIPIAPGAFVELGYAYTRYWSDETAIAATNGALYFPSYADYTNNSTLLEDHAYDTYRLLDPSINIVDNSDPDKLMGGSFPEYDNYNVVAQGLSGSMRPYAFQQALYSRNRHNSSNDKLIEDHPLSFTSKALGFRFENDFSNQYRQENGLMDAANYSADAYAFDQAAIHGEGNGAGYEANTGRLAGSKHIEWYTNQAIAQKQASGFINTDALGFMRSIDNETANQIGGFSVTNSSGVTYHFALPAYSFDETVYTTPIIKDDGSEYADGDTYNRLKKPAKYAYTWYLTAMTGPDYVDRNANGLVDASDWGYWVKFNYGKWSDRYGWRNPAQGFNRDVDSNLKTYSKGKKEVYYLNSVSTRTHTALFEKEIRNDGKSSTKNDSENKTYFYSNRQPQKIQIKPDALNSGFATDNSVQATTTYLPSGQSIDSLFIKTYSCTSLRLVNIILLNNVDVPASLASNSKVYTIQNPPDTPPVYDTKTLYATTISKVSRVDQSQYGDNVIDKNDIDLIRQPLIQKAIRVINFNHDYTSATGTPNSYTSFGTFTGKLTLKTLTFLGLGGSNVLPATRFTYEEESSKIKNMSIAVATGSGFAGIGTITVASGTIPTVGDILKYVAGNKIYYITVLTPSANPSSANQFDVRFLNAGISTPLNGTFQASTTKNPPYTAENRDWWGLFKSDFDNILAGVREGVGRRTTEISNQGVDVWSLRTITSSLGSKISINYQGDQYRKPGLSRPNMICRTDGDFRNSIGGLVEISTPFTAQQEESIFKNSIGVNAYRNYKTILFTGIVGVAVSRNLDNYQYKYTFVNRVPLYINSVKDRKLSVSESGHQVYTYNNITDQSGSHQRTVEYSFITNGYIEFDDSDVQNQIPGGGVRVESIGITAGNATQKTAYNYANLVTSNVNATSLTSGVTSFEPGSFLTVSDQTSQQRGVPQDIREKYKAAYMKSLPSLLAVAREIPAPGVLYEAVTVRESSIKTDGSEMKVPGFWTYHFSVFDPTVIGIDAQPVVQSTRVPNLYTRRVAIKDMTSRIGSLRSSTHWADVGKKLSETINHYLHEDISAGSNDATSQGSINYQNKLALFNYQGVIQESFGDSRLVRHDNDGDYDTKVIMSKRDVYPTILVSTSATDYLTGLTNTAQTLTYDFFSGSPTRTIAADGYGNRFLTETVPAYRRYPEMGLKLGSSTNKQMLTQTATTTTYKIDTNNNAVGVVAASAQTWSKQVPVVGLTDNNPEALSSQADTHIWRPWQSYSWMPAGTTSDGLTPLTGSNMFVGYDYNSPIPGASWKLISEVTLYNAYSNALEAKDINNTYLATKLGFNQSKVLITGGPAAYQELAYSGAEETTKKGGEYFSGGIAVTWGPGSNPAVGDPWGSGNVDISNRYAHTGTSSLRVGPYKHGFSYLLNAATANQNTLQIDPAKSYRLSVWASNAAGYLYYYLDGQEKAGVKGTVQKRTADGWYLLELTIPPVGLGHNYLRVGCYNPNAGDLSNLTSGVSDGSVYFDDFRFQPLSAQATSYVYDGQTGQVTDILDNSNMATHYEYDAAGKLRRVLRETLQYGSKQVAKYEYVYAAMAPLDMVSVLAPTITGNRTFSATLLLPSSLVGRCTVMYNTGAGSGTLTNPITTTPTIPCVYSAAGTYWLKITVRDQQNVSRDLAQKVVVQ